MLMMPCGSRIEEAESSAEFIRGPQIARASSLLDQADDGVDRLPVLGNVVIGRPLDGDDLVADLEPAAFARLRRNGLDDAIALHELLDGEPDGRFFEETQERGRTRQREDAAELEGVFGLRELRAGHKTCAERRTKQPCPNCAKR